MRRVAGRHMTAGMHAAMAAALLVALAGCEKVTHDKLDDWLSTRSGPEKLRKAVGDSDLDADLRAHAAQNLIRLGEEGAAFEAIEAASETSRKKIATKLAPRLWENARIDKPMAIPSPLQTTAKDGLYRLRALADEDTRAKIDGYLTDWLTGGWYDGRAESGVVPGEQIIRAIGPSSSPRMIAAIDRVIASPPDAQGATVKIGDKLLLGVAVSGSPESVGKLLDVIRSGQLARQDKGLPVRAMNALIIAYLAPEDFPAVEPGALAPHVATLSELARDENQPATIIQGAIDLVQKAGMPACLDPLVGMVTHPHANPRYRWIAAQRALDCGKLDALIPVVEAFPVNADTARDDLEGTVWERATQMGSRKQVGERARTLLSSDSWVARVTGAEVLARLADPASAAADAALVRNLAGDRTPLRGWWGDQEDLPAAKRKKVPTLGEVAAGAASRLEELAKVGQKKG